LGSLELAFVVDSATYVVSAILLFAMTVPRDAELEPAPMRIRAVWDEMVEGWRFLRHNAELFSNTALSSVAQLAVGAEIVATVPYAERVLEIGNRTPEEVYAWILGAIALGSVLGGIGVGAIGE